GLGTMAMSGIYGPADEPEAIAAIQRALDLGITLIDTAETYGADGHNERLVGRAIQGRRERVILATKFGGGLELGRGRPEYVRRAHVVQAIAAVQSEYSLWTRDAEAEVLPTARALGIGFVAYSPLGRGFLGGELRRPEDLAPGDWRRAAPRFQDENFRRNLDLAERLRDLASSRGL